MITSYTVLKQGYFRAKLMIKKLSNHFELLMASLQNLERTVVIAVVGFFSLILISILLCFCLFTVYNCLYKRMAQNHLKRMESETQTTDVENSASLRTEYDENLNGRHELMTRITRLWVSWMFPFHCPLLKYIERCNVFVGSSDWQFIISSDQADKPRKLLMWPLGLLKMTSIPFFTDKKDRFSSFRF